MKTNSFFLVTYLILFSVVTIQAQDPSLADSVKDRTEVLSADELRMYPLSDIQHLLQMKSSVYFIQDNAVQTGVFFSKETFSLDGMQVRGIEYLPPMGYSGLGLNRYNSLEEGFSPAGRSDFRTADMHDPFFKGEFRSNFFGMQEHISFSKSIQKHPGDQHPLECYF